MLPILLLLILNLILGMLCGWMFGTWQTRLRLRSNRGVKWNESSHYYRYWNPWHPCHKSHLLFTENELIAPIARAKRNPEDLRIPK